MQGVEQKVKMVSAMKRSLALITTLSLHLSVTVAWAAGAEYFVAGDGRDSNPGTSVEEPFRTIGRAAQILQPGDTCRIRGGVYRETVRNANSGQRDKPITFTRYQNERVIVDGSDVVPGPWTEDENGVWKTKVAPNRPHRSGLLRRADDGRSPLAQLLVGRQLGGGEEMGAYGQRLDPGDDRVPGVSSSDRT